MPAFHETPSTGPCADLAAAMQAMVPVLETKRLVLRAPRIEDFQDFARIVLSPQGTTYGDPANREEAWSEFMQLTGTWMLRGHGTWVVTLKTDGKTIGLVQLGAEPGDLAPELGYLLDAEFEGQGYASEAARAVRDHGFGTFELPKIASYIDKSNARSIALAHRLGAVEDTPTDWAEHDTLAFRHKAGGTDQ
ncbi:MAG: GNAT family N-acetyltransferase [Pseudomonadota bacterium]